MAQYRIPFEQTVTGYVVVDEPTLADAVREAEKEGLPPLMFINHKYPDEAGWEVDEEQLGDLYPGEPVWPDTDEKEN